VNYKQALLTVLFGVNLDCIMMIGANLFCF